MVPALFRLALFCVPLPQDQILSIHEPVLSQTARVMADSGEWLIPRRAPIFNYSDSGFAYR